MTYEESFDSLYGKESFARLRRLLQDPILSYEQIGGEFGVTRQRVSQLAQLMGINGRRRERERINRRLPCVANKRAKYPFAVRQVLGELQRRGISAAPHYTLSKRHRRVAYKQLRSVLVNGVLCKVGYRNTKKGARFTPFRVTVETRKAKAVVWGVRHGSTLRLYVIPLTELENIKRINIPVTGAYIRTSRKPIRDWTLFENAWHLLRHDSLKHSNATTNSKRTH
jgi:hypothetical protein